MSTNLSTLTPSADDAYTRSLLDAQCDPRAEAAQQAERDRLEADAITVRHMIENSGHNRADQRTMLMALGLI
jgi:ABC-type microcin C transport system duplicated ATPase subunit YejF